MQPIVPGQHWREQFRDLYVTHFDLCGDRLGRRRIHCVNLKTGRSTAIIEDSFRKYARLLREPTRQTMVSPTDIFMNERSKQVLIVRTVEWDEKKRYHVAVVGYEAIVSGDLRWVGKRKLDVLSLTNPKKYTLK